MTRTNETMALLILGVVVLGAIACGPGDLDAYREGRETATPITTPTETYVYALDLPAATVAAPSATATPMTTPTPTPTMTATPTPAMTPTAPPTVEPTVPVVRPQVPSVARGDAATSTGQTGAELLARCGRVYAERVYVWAPVAAQYSWDICEWANIVDCESDGDEWVMNYSGSGACGVMQHLPCQYLGDGAGSIMLGFEKYAARGWQPWTVGGCYPY